MTKLHGKALRLLLATSITGALLVMLLRHIPLHAIGSLFQKLDTRWAAVGFFLYLLSNGIRAYRFTHLFPNQKPSLKSTFAITALYNMYTGLFPVGLGEISFPVLMKKQHDVSLSTSSAVVLVARLYDFIAVFLLFGISLLTVASQLVVFPQALWPIVFTACLAFIFLLIKTDEALRLTIRGFLAASRNLPMLRSMDEHFRLTSTLGNLANAINTIRTNAASTSSLLQTFVMWLINGGVVFSVFAAMASPLTIFQAIFVNCFVIASMLVPLNTIGGFGFKEVVFTAALMWLGEDKTQAIPLAFGVHICLKAYLVSLGSWGILGYYVFARRRPNNS